MCMSCVCLNGLFFFFSTGEAHYHSKTYCLSDIGIFCYPFGAVFFVYGLSFWLLQQLLADPASYFLYTFVSIKFYSLTPRNVTMRRLTPSAQKQNTDVLLQLSVVVTELDSGSVWSNPGGNQSACNCL